MASEKRLIDMGNFLEVLRRYLNSSHVRKSGPVCCGMRIAIRSCIELLESQKPVDTVEVVHGRWEKASEKCQFTDVLSARKETCSKTATMFCQTSAPTAVQRWTEKGKTMGKESWIFRLLKKIGLIKTFEVDKMEMCKRAVDSGVCPRACDRCAWGERKDNG